MLEPNAVGVGGVYYGPAGSSIALDVVGDLVTKALPGRVVTAAPDPRELLIEELAAVGTRIRRPVRSIALIENTDFTTGTDEFQQLRRYLISRGLRAVVADPRDLRLSRGRITAKGQPVDLLYRDSELAEFIDMEQGRPKLTALRRAIQDGRLISGLTWEFDQKAAWELFTDPAYSRHFTASQRRLFRDHLLWTRLVREDRVTDPAGRLVDLPPFIRRNRRRLVLKPNTLFGGEGVVIGHTVSQAEWERELAAAIRGRQAYVVQQLAAIPTDTFPHLTPQGSAAWQEKHVVSGFFFSSAGIGLVGRFSGLPVVNVSRGGGLIPVLWAHG
jgi:hypothetical protein